MLSAEDVGVELVAGSLAMLTRQASLMKLHDLVSARGGLRACADESHRLARSR